MSKHRKPKNRQRQVPQKARKTTRRAFYSIPGMGHWRSGEVALPQADRARADTVPTTRPGSPVRGPFIVSQNTLRGHSGPAIEVSGGNWQIHENVSDGVLFHGTDIDNLDAEGNTQIER